MRTPKIPHPVLFQIAVRGETENLGGILTVDEPPSSSYPLPTLILQLHFQTRCCSGLCCECVGTGNTVRISFIRISRWGLLLLLPLLSKTRGIFFWPNRVFICLGSSLVPRRPEKRQKKGNDEYAHFRQWCFFLFRTGQL